MKRYIPCALALVVLAGIPPRGDAQEAVQDLLNNQYYVESLRLTSLAEESYDYGDYDASADYAAEALRYAQLSDEYVALQLKIKEANDAIFAANSRLKWAVSVKAATRYPAEFTEAQSAYDEAVSERSDEQWDEAIAAANRSINALAFIQGVPALPSSAAGRTGVLPAQYTVRTWPSERDCFWNIAAQPWVYGDPFKWRLLYNANKSKLANPDNPNVIEPGTVLDIPSLRGERREGIWDPSRRY